MESIEPRLLEYINRKRYFKQNQINCDTLEREYMITMKDRQLINAYLTKNKALQKDLSKDSQCEFIEVPISKQPLPSDDYKYDKRFDRLKRKIQKEKQALNIKEDISNLSRNYDLFSCPVASIGGNNMLNSTIDKDGDKDFNRVFQDLNLGDNSINNFSGSMPCKNKYFVNENQDPLLRKHKPPHIQYNQVVYDNQYNSYLNHQPSLDNVSEKINKYQNKINNSEDNYNSDRNYNNNVLQSNPCKKEQMMDSYKYVPEMTGGELKNIDIENYMKYSTPSSKAKSLGFENPTSHYFQYIDEDIQDPSHVCFERPQMSRLSNKQSVKYKQIKNY